MNVATKIKTLLEKTDGITNIWIDNDLDDERTDSIWYGGTVIEFDYKATDNKTYKVIYSLEGDVALYFTNPDTNEEFYRKDKNNAGDVGYELCCIGIDTDDKLRTLEEQATDLYWDFTNWYSLDIYDNSVNIFSDIRDGFSYDFLTEDQVNQTIKDIEAGIVYGQGGE